MKNIGIARQPVRLAKSLVADEDFNFVTTNDFGTGNVIEVAKTDVFAHQIADDDVAKIQDMESREGKYDDSYKVADGKKPPKKVYDWYEEILNSGK